MLDSAIEDTTERCSWGIRRMTVQLIEFCLKGNFWKANCRH
ncbi:hypothetical protein SLEP1_g19867 [Rubroshorea leprosula]|uniref:Uncharacterized protein n=1 Tax=Rubroshorea leprosula TaxID=152421 RepID=A0AAV5JBB8_9ROSI|nr:hypothetical protein SLEP1_g19867 [Rubroshorea leprosula]